MAPSVRTGRSTSPTASHSRPAPARRPRARHWAALAGALALGVVLAACQGELPEPDAADTGAVSRSTQAPTPSPSVDAPEVSAECADSGCEVCVGSLCAGSSATGDSASSTVRSQGSGSVATTCVNGRCTTTRSGAPVDAADVPPLPPLPALPEVVPPLPAVPDLPAAARLPELPDVPSGGSLTRATSCVNGSCTTSRG